jgi:SAM-dependent methyltransferase/uncharacterized protein YbaR (Trm112 family)
MRQETLSLLRCVAVLGDSPRRAPPVAEQPGRCDGSLTLRDEHALVCIRCGAIYPITDAVPWVLLEVDAANYYLDEETIRCYYEAHYAPYLRPTLELLDRLAFPQIEKARRAGEGVPVEGPHATRTARVPNDARRSTFYQSVSQLVAEQSLTDEFYQRMLEWCRPFIHEEAIVLDAGCGLGRMTGEMARLGARYVVGLDRSPRMAKEAVRILGTRSPLELTLNVIGAEGMGATLELGWALDNYDVIIGDVERLPLRTAGFDLVTGFNLVDRVSDPRRMADELGRVLKPGGHLIIADPYHWEEQFTPRPNWIGDMATLFDAHHWRRVREADGIPFVMRYYSRRISIYMNHCLIYRKAEQSSKRARTAQSVSRW